MKKQLLLLSLMFTGIVAAQNITIPDANFKSRLLLANTMNNIAKDANGASIVVDTNSDGEIQEAEALLVYELTMFNQDISSLDGIGNFINLTYLNVGNNDISSLDVSSLINLSNLIISGNDLTSLDVSWMNNLEHLNVNGNQLNSLNITGCANLATLSCNSNQLTTINLNGFAALTSLNCGHNLLTELDLSQVNLLSLYCGGNLLTVLDISNQTNLQNFAAYDNNNLVELYMKNGNVDNINVETFAECENLEVICADEEEMQLILDTIAQLQEWDANVNIFVTTYCSFTPGGDYNTIAGTVSFDGDNNGCDENEALNAYIKINVDFNGETGATFTNNTDGAYNFYVQATDDYIITPEIDSNWFTFTPASATVTVSEINNSTITQNFCITANGVHPDVEVVVVPLSTAQPGFDANYKVVYKNKGNQTLSGDVTLGFDDALIDFVTATPVETAMTAGQLTWSYTNLLPFESRAIMLTVNVNSPQETPAVEIGNVLVFTASVTPATGDETPADNTFTLDHVVTGSFDPNDITCLEGATVTPDKVGDYLHYNINFENTGDAAATFIVVKDIIDETQFDISTLQVLDASHAMETTIEGNEVEFYFDAINLGPQEKGNIVFKIKSLNTLQVNDDVTQQANIFFDYNWPIETNEATTVFAALSTGNFVIDASVTVYPNPSGNIVNIAADGNIKSYELYDVQGRLLQSAIVNEAAVKLDISQRAAGIYFLKAFTNKGVKVEKIVKE